KEQKSITSSGKRSIFFERLKQWCIEHATPIDMLTLVIAGATLWQVIVMQKQMRLDERAWVGMLPPKVKGFDFPNGAGEYTYTVKNFGKTPALAFTDSSVVFADTEESVP